MNPLQRTALVAMLLFLGTAQAHICIIHPHQRGELDISIPGSPACYRRTAYCGGVPIADPLTSFVAGEMATIHLQQNLNHYWPQQPGMFDIAISFDLSPTDSSWQILDQWDDWSANDMVWQMNFTRQVRMPSKVSDHCILRTRYVSHNQDEVDPANNHDAIFYNCADIALVPGLNSSSAPSTQHPAPLLSVPPQAEDCCTLPQWTASAYSQSDKGTTLHTISYDAKRQFVTWDRTPLWDPSQHLITITNYTSGNPDGSGPYLEFLYRPAAGTCEVYGADRFYDWCFGSKRSQTYAGSFRQGDVEVNEWRGESNGFQFASLKNGCYPFSIKQGELSMQFTDWTDSVNPSAFEIPAVCLQAASDVSLVACGHQEQ